MNHLKHDDSFKHLGDRLISFFTDLIALILNNTIELVSYRDRNRFAQRIQASSFCLHTLEYTYFAVLTKSFILCNSSQF